MCDKNYRDEQLIIEMNKQDTLHKNLLEAYDFIEDICNHFNITEYCNADELLDKISEFKENS